MRKLNHVLGVSLLITIMVMASISGAASEKAAAGHEWSYEGKHGPMHWGDVKSDYAMCKTGQNQSPIDITNSTAADLPPIQFAYLPTQLKIINNGHTIQINYAEGSSISVGGKSYQLVQFHFHHPSEEKIKGKGFDMVAHLVHKNADGNLAVIAVLIKRGQANKFIENLWAHLPKEEGTEEAPANVTIDVTKLLPAQHGYYTFTGSLTTPPCSEGVTWFVLKTPIELSDAQIRKFAHIYKNNARPIQPLHDRVISESRSM